MRQIRRNVFETNSSSTHSITMCSFSEYTDWQNGKVYLNDTWISSYSEYRHKHFVTKEEILDIFNKCAYVDELGDFNSDFDKFIREYDFYTYDRYWEDKRDYYDTFSDTYTTPNGDTVMAFGYYGYDG